MSQPCSTCGYQNSADSVFCIRCGGKIEAEQVFQQSTSSTSATPIGRINSAGNFGSTTYSSGYQAQGAQAQSAAIFSSAPAQMGSVSSASAGQTAPHAFAGRGELIKHHSWLLYGDHLNAANLRSAILDILRLRYFSPLKLDTEKLRESGYWTEERDYITMRRGVTTVFIYVAPAGQDLYISRATAVQLSIDPVRIIILCSALAVILFGPPIMQSMTLSMVSSAITGNSGSAFGLTLSFIIILGIVLVYLPSIISLFPFLIASFKHWLTERDLWVYLRRNHLHDFEIDDVMLLEHATDEAVRAAVKQLNLDATKIVPPAQGYQTKRRVRVI